MTEYCKTGDKPKIKYKFANGKERIYQSDFSPVEVIQKEIPAEAEEEYKNVGYRIEVKAVNGYIDIVVVAHKEIFLPGGVIPEFPFGGRFLFLMTCGETSYKKESPCNRPFSQAIDCLYGGFNLNPGSYIIDPTIHCPIPNKQRCSILVKHKGIIIFQDQGDCPLSISVQCGNCPEDMHECTHQAYPGYCCVPCKETGDKLKNIANKVGR
jgi:hypothetical protein